MGEHYTEQQERSANDALGTLETLLDQDDRLEHERLLRLSQYSSGDESSVSTEEREFDDEESSVDNNPLFEGEAQEVSQQEAEEEEGRHEVEPDFFDTESRSEDESILDDNNIDDQEVEAIRQDIKETG